MNQDVANLWAIAVGDDNFVFFGQISDNFADFFSNFFLSFGGGFTIFLEGIAAKCDDDALFHYNTFLKNSFTLSVLGFVKNVDGGPSSMILPLSIKMTRVAISLAKLIS